MGQRELDSRLRRGQESFKLGEGIEIVGIVSESDRL